jgi:hypothetical protein
VPAASGTGIASMRPPGTAIQPRLLTSLIAPTPPRTPTGIGASRRAPRRPAAPR